MPLADSQEEDDVTPDLMGDLSGACGNFNVDHTMANPETDDEPGNKEDDDRGNTVDLANDDNKNIVVENNIVDHNNVTTHSAVADLPSEFGLFTHKTIAEWSGHIF